MQTQVMPQVFNTKTTAFVEASNSPQAFNIADLEALAFKRLKLDNTDSYKRMCLYIVLATVELYENLGESALIYHLTKRYQYPDVLVKDALYALTSASILPVLRWWKNDNLRKRGEKFYRVNQFQPGLFGEYKKFILAQHPEFLHINLKIPAVSKG